MLLYVALSDLLYPLSIQQLTDKKSPSETSLASLASYQRHSGVLEDKLGRRCERGYNVCRLWEKDIVLSLVKVVTGKPEGKKHYRKRPVMEMWLSIGGTYGDEMVVIVLLCE